MGFRQAARRNLANCNRNVFSESALVAKQDVVITRAPETASANSLVALVITLLIQTAAVAAVLAPAAIAPAIAATMKLPVAAIGTFIAIVYLSAICAALSSGAMIQKWGAIRTSQLGLLSCAAGSLCVASGVTELGLAGAVLIGLGYGPITPASSHILVRTTPPNRLWSASKSYLRKSYTAGSGRVST